MAGKKPRVNVEDEYQNTMSFDDIIVPESPLGTPNLNAGTEMLDTDIDNEVVPDSDDEGVQRTKVANLINDFCSDKTKTSSGGNKAGYFRRPGGKIRGYLTDKGNDSGPNSIYANTNILKQLKCKKIDGVEDQVTVDGNVKDGAQENRNRDCNGKVNDFLDKIKSRDMVRKMSTAEAQEKEEPESNREAMDGEKDTSLLTSDHDLARLRYIDAQETRKPSKANVDHYLSVIDVNFSPEIERGKITGIKSPPTFGKGHQTLARRANLTRESGSFHWSDNRMNDQAVFLGKRKEALSGCKSHGKRSVSMSQVVGNLNFQKEIKDFGVQGKINLKETLINENYKYSRLMACNSNKIPNMVQTAKIKSDANSIEDLDKQFGADLLGQHLENNGIERDVSDSLDVGFDTQMAAEVMESLMFAPPLSRDTTAPQAVENSFEDSPKVETVNKTSKCSSFHEVDGSEVIPEQSKRTTRPRNKVSKNGNCSSPNDENRNKFDPELPVKEKVMRGMLLNERENIEGVGRNPISSKSVNCDSHYKGRNRGQLKISLPMGHRTRQYSSVLSPKCTEDPPCNFGESLISVKEVNFQNKRRKRSKLDSDVFQVLDVRKTCPKRSNTHCEATNSTIRQQLQSVPFVTAYTSHLKLDFWSYPKKKRTSRNGKTQSVGIHQKSQETSKTTHFISHVVRKARSTRQLRPSIPNKHVESFSRLNSGEPSLVDVKCDSLDGQLSHINSNVIKASSQFGAVGDANLMLSVDGARENLKFDELPTAKRKALPAYKGTENCKQLLKKSSMRLPLVKELSRLGFADSLPELASKDLRRRRNMANIQVLFSQSLDDEILKQQRKILGQLGISIASHCSEATHFVTDRFVRTRNMLEAIALGKPVVTHLWLEDCAQTSCFIDEKKYILRDTKKEKEIGFSMPDSLARARHHPVLEGRRVVITPNVKPCKEMIESLVKAVHGQAVEKIQRAATSDELILDDLLILSCEEDYAMCVPFLEEGVAIYSSELLLSGIVTQKLHYARHQLFANCVKRKSTPGYSRKRRDRSLRAAQC